MKKNQKLLCFFKNEKWRKTIRTMKMMAVLFLLFNITVIAGQSAGDEIYFNLKMKDATLVDILMEIENISGLGFLFKSEEFEVDQRMSVNLRHVKLTEALDEILDKCYSYQILDNSNIVITKIKETSDDPVSQPVRTITGRVTDEKGDPLIGVSVVIKGTTIGTVTDLDGNFTISGISDDAVLQFSYIGMQAEEIIVGEKETIRLIMIQEAIGLSEVIAIGYGARKKETLTGAISYIKSEDILTTTHSSLAQSLQGKIAGLQIRQYTGEPGDFNAMINIRGFGSPLYVIDGVVRDGGSEFQKLNPEDIESISVLKDASAAIYGLNAANGVIIVTTKKGSMGKVRFNYNTSLGFITPTNIPRMADAAEYMEMRNDALVTIGESPYLPESELEKYKQGAPGYEGTDWYDETMKKYSNQIQHNFSAQGGNEFVHYFLSFGYLGENGLLKSGDLDYQKYTFRSNITTQLTRNLTAEVNFSGRNDRKRAPGQIYENILKGTRVSLPTEPVYANDNPEYLSVVAPTNLNPVAYADREYTGYNDDRNKFLQTTLVLTYKAPFLEGLEIKGLGSFDSNNYGGKDVLKSYKLYTYDEINDIYIANEQRKPSRISNAINDNNRLTLQAHLVYNKTIANDHNVGVTLVYEQRQGWSRYSYLEREYEFYTNDQINQASVNNQITDGNETDWANLSYLGRLTYNFKGKYLVEYAARYNGSYRYAPGKKYGYFPVISGGWRMSEESFIKNNLTFISNIKIRGSYGIVGEDVGVPFQWAQGFSTAGGGGYEFINGIYTQGAASPTIVNPSLTWSESNIKNIGIDIGLLRGKLAMEFDVYQRDRSGLLAVRDVVLPNTFGGTLPEENLNSDRVRGIEFILAHNNKIGELNYSLAANFNYARTMNVHVERAPFQSSYDRWRNGLSDRWSDVVWAYDLMGQFQNLEEVIMSPGQNGTLGNLKELPGDYKYRDVNGDGLIDNNDMLPLFWGGEPKLHFGLSFSATWKNFDLFALLQGSGKYSMRFWGGGSYGEMFCFGGNLPAYFYDRWHPVDPYDPNSEWVSGEWPATRTKYDVGAMYYESAAWRNDASYIRLKTIDLGYTLTNDVVNKVGIDNLRLFVNVHNLFTICDPWVKIFDPEKIEGVGGVIGLAYPVTASYNFGLNVKF